MSPPDTFFVTICIGEGSGFKVRTGRNARLDWLFGDVLPMEYLTFEVLLLFDRYANEHK